MKEEINEKNKKRLGYLIAMPSIQDGVSFGNSLSLYSETSLGRWDDIFSDWLKSERSELWDRVKAETGGEIEDTYFAQAPSLSPDSSPVAKDLIFAWSEWLIITPIALSEVGHQLYEWLSEWDDTARWKGEGRIESYDEAVLWCSEIWPDLEWYRLSSGLSSSPDPLTQSQEPEPSLSDFRSSLLRTFSGECDKAGTWDLPLFSLSWPLDKVVTHRAFYDMLSEDRFKDIIRTIYNGLKYKKLDGKG